MSVESSGESMRKEPTGNRTVAARLLDGAIEWHPPRIATGLLDRLEVAASWREAALAMAESITHLLGASASRVWIKDRSQGRIQRVERDESLRPDELEFDPKAMAWLMSPGVRRVASAEAREDPMLQQLVGPVGEGRCALLLTTPPEIVPPSCLAWVIDEARIPSWTGRVLSEFAVGTPSWWRLRESCREQAVRLEAAEKDRRLAMACRGLLHDLVNVLFPIRCRIDLLYSPLRSCDELRHLEAIGALVDQLQELAAEVRTQVDEEPVSTEPTDLSAWWSEHRSTVAAALPPHVTLIGAIPDGLPPVAMPAPTLAQAVLNLVTNAGKSVGGDGVVIVSARRIAHRRIRVVVADNGSGIAPASLEAIRQTIRQRRANGLAREGPGKPRNGFGLAIVEELVERCGGSFEIDSAVGDGTRMGIALPIAGVEAGEVRRAIVEIEDPRRRWVITELLRGLGVRARPHRNGSSAAAATGDGTGPADSVPAAVADAEAEAPEIWIADGPQAETPALLRWLEADQRRIAVALGDSECSHERLRVLDSRLDDAEMSMVLERAIESQPAPSLARP